MQEVQQLIEPARVATATTESISAKIRVLWVFRDSPRVASKRDRLSTCHQFLNNIILILYTRQFRVTAQPLTGTFREALPYTKDTEIIFNWQSRMRGKKKTTAPMSNDELTPLPLVTCDPSTGAPLYPVANLFRSAENSQRAALVCCLSEPFGKVKPSPPYPYYDNLYMLQVFDSERIRQLSRNQEM